MPADDWIRIGDKSLKDLLNLFRRNVADDGVFYETILIILKKLAKDIY